MVTESLVPGSTTSETVHRPVRVGALSEAALFWGLVALIAFAPLPLGSNRPVWWSFLGVWVGLLFLVYAFLRWQARSNEFVPASKVLAIVIPFLLAIGWALLQIFPWMPDSVAHPLWMEAGDFLQGDLSSTISINPYETGTGVMRLLTYGAIFWIALQLGRDNALAQKGLRAIIVISLVYGAYGVIVHLGGWERILWFHKWAYEGYLASTFVNRNSYATYAGIGLICVAGLLLHDLGTVLRLKAASRTKVELTLEMLTGKSAYLVVTAVVLCTALLLSGSRAGVASTLLGVIVLILCCGYAKVIPRNHTWMFVTAAFVSAFLFLAVSGGSIIDRLSETEASGGGRTDIYRLTWEAINAAPVTGSGLGTFTDVYPIFRDSRLPPGPPWQDTHNTYLENALELGIPATLLLIVSIASMGELCLFGLIRRRRAKIFAAIGLSVLTLIAFHALVDFSMEIPAVTATFAFVMGIACAQSFSSRRRRKHRTQQQDDDSDAKLVSAMDAPPAPLPERSMPQPDEAPPPTVGNETPDPDPAPPPSHPTAR